MESRFEPFHQLIRQCVRKVYKGFVKSYYRKGRGRLPGVVAVVINTAVRCRDSCSEIKQQIYCVEIFFVAGHFINVRKRKDCIVRPAVDRRAGVAQQSAPLRQSVVGQLMRNNAVAPVFQQYLISVHKALVPYLHEIFVIYSAAAAYEFRAHPRSRKYGVAYFVYRQSHRHGYLFKVHAY